MQSNCEGADRTADHCGRTRAVEALPRGEQQRFPIQFGQAPQRTLPLITFRDQVSRVLRRLASRAVRAPVTIPCPPMVANHVPCRPIQPRQPINRNPLRMRERHREHLAHYIRGVVNANPTDGIGIHGIGMAVPQVRPTITRHRLQHTPPPSCVWSKPVLTPNPKRGRTQNCIVKHCQQPPSL